MPQLSQKDFDQALGRKEIAGTYILDPGYVLDYPFEGFFFHQAQLFGSSFTCSTFRHCRFWDVIFENIHLDYCTFEECSFENTEFRNCTTDDIELISCEGTPTII